MASRRPMRLSNFFSLVSVFFSSSRSDLLSRFVWSRSFVSSSGSSLSSPLPNHDLSQGMIPLRPLHQFCRVNMRRVPQARQVPILQNIS